MGMHAGPMLMLLVLMGSFFPAARANTPEQTAISVMPVTNPPSNCYAFALNGTTKNICLPVSPDSNQSQGQGQVGMKPLSLKSENDLVNLLTSNPRAYLDLMRILEFSGIVNPWPEFFDLTSEKQHTLPAPEPMFKKIQELLNGMEIIKETVAKELNKVGTFVSRGKGYLEEDLLELQQHHDKLEKFLSKIQYTKSAETKNYYASKFLDEQRDTQDKIKSYAELKAWLHKTLTLFGSLFN
jgi:hypothetical protein